MDIPPSHVAGVQPLVSALLANRRILSRGSLMVNVYGYGGRLWTVRHLDGSYAYYATDELNYDGQVNPLTGSTNKTWSAKAIREEKQQQKEEEAIQDTRSGRTLRVEDVKLER